jgi:cadmium resistance protein CadD (predicted permease)
VLFASTNVDDIFVLVGFFADPKFRARNIVLGQYAGIVMLFGLSLLGSLLSLVIPREYIGLLGYFCDWTRGEETVRFDSQSGGDRNHTEVSRWR